MNSNNPYPADAFFDIETLINVAQPSSILLIGDENRHFLDGYIAQKALLNQVCTVTHITTSDIARLSELQQTFDVSIAINLLEHLGKTSGSQVLSRLRDILSQQYCVCLPISGLVTSEQKRSHPNRGVGQTDQQPARQDWQLTELFSFALKRVASYHHNDVEYGLFKYTISDYKNTPDWLNADNWANPEMWGKYWW